MNERFSIIRKRLRLSQSQMATELGIRQASISDIERGKTELSNKIILLLHEKYNISFEWIYTGKGDMVIGKSDNYKERNISERETDKIMNEHSAYLNSEKQKEASMIRQITNRLLRSKGYEKIQNEISDFTDELMICEQLLRLYSIHFQMNEFSEKYQRKLLEKKDLENEFDKKANTMLALFDVIKPYINQINELSSKLDEFDNEQLQIFWINLNE